MEQGTLSEIRLRTYLHFDIDDAAIYFHLQIQSAELLIEEFRCKFNIINYYARDAFRR